jgi:hypothetical protein
METVGVCSNESGIESSKTFIAVCLKYRSVAPLVNDFELTFLSLAHQLLSPFCFCS